MSMHRTIVALGAACTGLLAAVACTFPSISYENGTGGSGGPGSTASHSASSSSASPSSGSTASTSSTSGSTSSSSAGSSSSTAATASSSGSPCAAPCKGGFVCESNACLTFCTKDEDCAMSVDYCENPGPQGMCVPKQSAGMACTSDTACASGVCGTTMTGHCCSMACKVGGPCGATGCDGSGNCVYPPGMAACGGSCTGDELTPSGHCDGAGSCVAPNPMLCPGNLVCESSTSCYTGCGAHDSQGDANCQMGYYCNGMGMGACQPQGGSGAMCTSNDECSSGTCQTMFVVKTCK